MVLYSKKVIDHVTHPRNAGFLEDADAVGETGNATCGDVMKLYLKIRDDVIQDVRYETYGCGAAIAAGSMATEMIKGKSLAEAAQLTNLMVSDALDGLPPEKMHCSVLAEQTIRAAIQDYWQKRR